MDGRLPWNEAARVLYPIVGSTPAQLAMDGRLLDHRPHLSRLWVKPALTVAECRAVLESAALEPYERGDVNEPDGNYRKCTCAWLPAERHMWLYERVCSLFEEANETYRFSLVGLVEPVMALAYLPGDTFDWHLDVGPELAANRKLSMSILLNSADSYEGGMLEFAGQATALTNLNAGTAIVFPSYLAHRIAPVTGGSRFSMVAFACGHSFG